MKDRGFETAKGFEDQNICIPKRSTQKSAGYDIEAAFDYIIPPFQYGDKPFLVETGLKAYMQEDEFLMLCNRSSNPFKKGLVMANSVGIIDADYYGNSDNDGAIKFAFYNFKSEPVVISKHERIGQAIFMKYQKADDDQADGERSGGFGSTNQ